MKIKFNLLTSSILIENYETTGRYLTSVNKMKKKKFDT